MYSMFSKVVLSYKLLALGAFIPTCILTSDVGELDQLYLIFEVDLSEIVYSVRPK